MTNITTPSGWPDVPQLETTTLAKGGVGGPMNSQAVALTARSQQLKELNFEALRRSYAEAGYNLVSGSFEDGGTGTINTSDSREKTTPKEIDEVLLDVADDIDIDVWKWLSSISEKGDHSARWHFGPIAQQVRDAFVKHGIDGCDYGLLCYDKWDDEFVDVIETITNEDGDLVECKTGDKIQTQWAGDRWGLRPDQCLWLLAAAARRRSNRLEKRILKIEEKLASMENN